jgi:hypothetical protein
VVGRDVGPVLGAEQILEEHLQPVRQPLGAVDRGQPIDLVRLAADV